MRKRLLIIVLLALGGCFYKATTDINKEELYVNDYASSASVVYQYLDYYVKEEELLKAINSNQGITVLATLNSDGTSNIAVFEFQMLDLKYGIITFTSENQSLLNLRNKPQGMLTFTMYKKDEREVLSYVGAKILVDYLLLPEDIELFQVTYGRLLTEQEALFRIVEIRPFG